MNNLLEFLRKYYHWILFLALEAVSFVLLFYFNTYQGSVWFTSANHVTASISRLYGDMQAYAQLQTVNRELTDRNILLQRQVDALRERLADLDHDTTVTERLVRESLAGYRLIPAKVVSNSVARTNNYLVIDRGERDGVRPEMGVVASGAWWASSTTPGRATPSCCPPSTPSRASAAAYAATAFSATWGGKAVAPSAPT